MKVFCQGSPFILWHLWTFPLLDNSAIINFESTSFTKQVWLYHLSPLLSLWDHDYGTNNVLDFNEALWKFLVYASDVLERIKELKRYLDDTYLLCSSYSVGWNTLIIFLVDLRLFFGMDKLHNPAVLTGEWWLCKRKISWLQKIVSYRRPLLPG